MPRDSRKVNRHKPAPDFLYRSPELSKFINKVMYDGKKSTARRAVYGALEIIKKETGKNPLEVFNEALKNATPLLQVKARRIGGATYQIPNEVKGDRKLHLAISWLRDAARSRAGEPFEKALAKELMEAAEGAGGAVKKKEEMHRLAEANRAMAHLARY